MKFFFHLKVLISFTRLRKSQACRNIARPVVSLFKKSLKLPLKLIFLMREHWQYCTAYLTLSLLGFSDKITSSSETFGEQEALELMDILTQYLGMMIFFNFKIYEYDKIRFEDPTAFKNNKNGLSLCHFSSSYKLKFCSNLFNLYNVAKLSSNRTGGNSIQD